MFNFQTRRVNGGKIFRNNISVKRKINTKWLEQIEKLK